MSKNTVIDIRDAIDNAVDDVANAFPESVREYCSYSLPGYVYIKHNNVMYHVSIDYAASKLDMVVSDVVQVGGKPDIGVDLNTFNDVNELIHYVNTL